MSGKMVDVTKSDIRIDKDGVWYYRGAEMFRKDIVNLFYKHLKMDECGRYLIEFPNDRCYIDVEDTAYVVKAVYQVGKGDGYVEGFRVLLSDDTIETLDPETLEIGEDNVLYCKVCPGKFPARFTRAAYYQIANFIEFDADENRFYLQIKGQRFYLKQKNQ
ncbi:MAG: DUF1285 domain-containing protein [Syntrophales bacterium]|nr:DUF1285 domain-containing protein [Syntrophales bacterium]